jgi:hypothetical protein
LGWPDADRTGCGNFSWIFRKFRRVWLIRGKTAFFVSQITALTRKLTQYPAQKRRLKLAKVLAIVSVLEVAMEDLQVMSDRNFIFEYSAEKTALFKIVRKLFHGVGCVIEITQDLCMQEMVSRRDLQ